MAFTCQREVSVMFGSSSSAVYTLRTSFRGQLDTEQTPLAYRWSVGQGSHRPAPPLGSSPAVKSANPDWGPELQG